MIFRRGHAVLLNAILNSVLNVRAIIKQGYTTTCRKHPLGGVREGLDCYVMRVGHLLPKI